MFKMHCDISNAYIFRELYVSVFRDNLFNKLLFIKIDVRTTTLVFVIPQRILNIAN